MPGKNIKKLREGEVPAVVRIDAGLGGEIIPKAQRDRQLWAEGLTEKHGKRISIEELNAVERWYTDRATRLGVDIDKSKGIGSLISVFVKIVTFKEAAEDIAGRKLSDKEMDTLALPLLSK